MCLCAAILMPRLVETIVKSLIIIPAVNENYKFSTEQFLYRHYMYCFRTLIKEHTRYRARSYTCLWKVVFSRK